MRRIAASAAVLATAALLAVSATTVPAAAASGACPDRHGITVVVDFTDLGGGVVVRCAPGPFDPGTTGWDALEGAGFTVDGVLRQPGFVCRIDGQPGVGVDACVDTPPTSAYWSYWRADRGGRWTYSSMGAGATTAEAGSVEGWAFARDRTAGAVPAPRVAPPPPPAPPTTAPAPAPSPPSASGSVAGVTTIRPTTVGSAAAAGGAASSPTGGAASGTPSRSAPTGTGGTGAVAATTTIAGTAATSTTTIASRTEVAAATGHPQRHRDDATGGGAALPAVLVLVLVAALATAAGTLARRRSHAEQG